MNDLVIEMLADKCLTLNLGVTKDIMAGMSVELKCEDMASMVIDAENRVSTVNEAARRIGMTERLVSHQAQKHLVSAHQRTG